MLFVRKSTGIRGLSLSDVPPLGVKVLCRTHLVARKIHESLIFAGQASQHNASERATGRFWVVLGQGGSDQAETGQRRRASLEL